MPAMASEEVAAEVSTLPLPETGEAHASIAIGPIRIDALDETELTRRLVENIFYSTKTHHVVTANAQFYNLAEQDGTFRKCIAEAEYVCADGVSVVTACKWLRGANVTRVPGVDLVDRLCQQSSVFGFSVYFLGGKPGSGEMAAALLSQKYPGLRVAGSSCPPWGFEKDPEVLSRVLEDIRRASPAVLLVALGAPRQEYFIAEHIRPLQIPVAIGVGGSFEMIAGKVNRAPVWVQRVGMEWAYRWAQEPRRLAKRYAVGNLQFAFYLVRYRFRGFDRRVDMCSAVSASGENSRRVSTSSISEVNSCNP